MFGGPRIISLYSCSNLELQQKTKRRNAGYRNANTTAIVRSKKNNIIYAARDIKCSNTSGQAIYKIVFPTKTWSPELEAHFDLIKIIQCWGRVGGFEKKFNYNSISNLLGLKIQDWWRALYKLCYYNNCAKDLFRLLFLLGLIAFGQPKSLPTIKFLLTIAFSPTCEDLAALSHTLYDLTFGNTLVGAIIYNAIAGAAILFSMKKNTLRGTKKEKR